jgi:hypothetical protein
MKSGLYSSADEDWGSGQLRCRQGSANSLHFHSSLTIRHNYGRSVLGLVGKEGKNVSSRPREERYKSMPRDESRTLPLHFRNWPKAAHDIPGRPYMDCSVQKVDVTTNVVGDTFFIRLVSSRPPGQYAPLVSISRKRKWSYNVHFFFRDPVLLSDR